MSPVPWEKERRMIPFQYLAGNPTAWQAVAHDLVCSANLLLDILRESDGQNTNAEARGGNVWRTVMMLYGLAAENLIKAIIVAKHSGIASKGTFPDWFKKHNLAALATRASLFVSHSQKHLLKRLQEFVECGKYPVGLREAEGRSTWVHFGSLDWNDTLQLLGYLEEGLERTSGGYAVACPDLRGLHTR
jgi:hypothetical protein